MRCFKTSCAAGFLFFAALLSPSQADLYVDALEPASWNGIVFVLDDKAAVQLRVVAKDPLKDEYQRSGRSVWDKVVLPGPHDPTGAYAELRWRTFGDAVLRFRWRRRPDGVVAAALSSTKEVSVILELYAPWSFQAQFQIVGDRLGAMASAGSGYARFHLLPSRAASAAWTVDTKKAGDSGAALQYDLGPGNPLYFSAAMSKEGEVSRMPAPEPASLERELQRAARNYSLKRVSSDGLLADCAEAVTQSLFWSRIYHPVLGRPFQTVTRPWCEPEGYVILCWDSFFNALLDSIESPGQAKDMLRALFSLQLPDGMIATRYDTAEPTPSRSQPPVGALCVWKVFMRTGDRGVLEESYGPLLGWHRWWFGEGAGGRPRRDGNRDGLLEWGSGVGPLQDAMYESGLDDSPMYRGEIFNPKTGTMELDDVGLNSLFALDAEILARMGEALGRPGEEVEALRQEAEVMRKRINASLWDPKTGMYLNRRWDGAFSQRKSPTLFYPLLAGVPDEERAGKMLRHLLDPKLFWGEYVVPTISRDDPDFPRQHYWRGKIWGPTNYLVYQGLKRYGFDVEAGAFARKSARLFLRNWERDRGCYENFLAGGAGSNVKHYTWGALLCLVGLEELIDVEPWGGLRIGTLSAESASVKRILVGGAHWDVSAGPSGLTCLRENRLLFKTDGPAIVRDFSEDGGGARFTIFSPRPVVLYWYASAVGSAREDGADVEAAGRDPSKIRISAGRHEVRLFPAL
jgi:hypothetical protein